MTLRNLTAAGVLLTATTPAFAGRPLEVDDAFPVDKGRFELEFGTNLVRDGSTRNVELAATLAYGLFENFEIAIDFGLQRERRNVDGFDERVESLNDTILSAKWLLIDQDETDDRFGPLGRPAFTLQPLLKLPTASESKDLGTGNVDGGLIGIATWERKDDWGIDLNFGYTFLETFRGNVLDGELFAGIAGRWKVRGFDDIVTSPIWLVGEVFGSAPDARLGDTVGGITGGFRLGLTDDLVFDFAVGTAVGPDTPDYVVTTGITWTF